MIKLQNINKTFNKRKPNEVVALSSVSLDFPEKGLVVLFGHSGSGKTTLLNIVGGLDSPSAGSIVFNDTKFNKYKANQWDTIRNENIGYIFQNYFLQPNETVFDNVSFSLKLIGITDPVILEERVRYVLRQVNMDSYRNKLAAHLSGGQQQRVAIARALVKDPKVIIADEPTGNLDSQNKIDVMNVIKKISENSLVILVTHEPNIAQFYGDRIIEVKDGNIIDDRENISSAITNNNFNNDRLIYLKDLASHEKLEKDNIKVDYYNDQANSDVKIGVKLVVRNNALFIEVDRNSKFNQINLLNDRDHIKLVDENYEEKSRDEILTTSFDRDLLNTSNVKRSRSSIISFKNSFFIALKRIINFGRKGKLALFSFLIAGAVFAYAAINIIGLIQLDPQDYMNVPSDYLIYSTRLEEADDLISLYGDDLEVLPSKMINASFKYRDYNNNGFNTPQFNVSLIKYVDHYNDELLGNEIVVTTTFYDGIYNPNSFGIYSYDHLIGETIVFPQGEYIIKDVIKSHYSTVYFKNYENLAIASVTNSDYVLTGEDDLYYKRRIMTNNSTMSLNVNGSNIDFYSYFMFNGDKEDRIQYQLDNLSYPTINDPHADALLQLQNERTTILTTVIPTAIVFLGIALVGFYFIIRSSMFNRIYQLGLFRVLGVRKKEIVNSFIIEIVLLVTISSLIGYSILYFIINEINSIQLIRILNVGLNFTSFSIGIGFMYLLFILLGLLPVFNLLRRTPTEIITKYDI